MILIRLVPLFALSVGLAYGVGTDDQVDEPINYGTFQDPSSNVRPRFRYWPNDASVNLSQVADDVKNAGLAGAGGVELLGYYLYGDTGYGGDDVSPLQSDWTVYGWGLPSWKQLLDTVLSTAEEEGLLIDLALGPNQGAGVPAPYDSDGLLWDLSSFNVTVPVGGSFNGTLPGWGTGPLVSASTGLLLNQSNGTSGETNVLSAASLTDVTQSVGSSGSVTISFPSNSTGLNYTIFAYYLIHSEYREQVSPTTAAAAVPQSPVANWTQNGSWVVDHFSARGAQVIIDFWEQQLLDDSTRQLIEQTGNYIWEDSQEYLQGVRILWTSSLPDYFLNQTGYQINKWLPVILQPQNSFGVDTSTEATYITDEDDEGQGHINDYRQTLTGLNQIYLQTLSDWGQNLSIQFSAQVVYNLPMDMLANIPYVNAPECETLGFTHNIDGYKQFAGPANLAGKRIISSETGAIPGYVYQQTLPDLLWDVKRSIAGGVNQFILHGYPYSGDYGNTTWPSFTTFAYGFSEMHGRHQPAWDFYSDALNYISRSQYVTQTGIPKVDLAFYLKLLDYTDIDTQYYPTDLADAGFSYEYLSPDNFGLPEAYVANGTFAPNRQAFKAIIVENNATLTTLGAQKLSEYANAGLPLIFFGGVPTNFTGGNASAAQAARQTISNLTTLANVHTTSGSGLASTLISLGIQPSTLVQANTTWLTYWRQNGTTSLIYVYNDASNIPAGGGSSTGNITFETTGTPYFYDAWTGNISGVPVYQQTSNTTTIPLSLAGNQTVIIGFSPETASTLHATPLPSSVPLITSSNGSVTFFLASSAESQTVTLSNNSTITLPESSLPSIALTNWTLTVESWTSPSNPEDLSGSAARTNTTYGPLPSTLVPWNQISTSLTNVSGRGYYSTEFTWPPSSSDTPDGAILTLPPIYHTARVLINNITLPPLDVTYPEADIGAYLNQGENTIDIVTSTPLGNVVRGIWDSLETSGKLATVTEPTPPGEKDYGIIGTVDVIGYKKISASA